MLNFKEFPRGGASNREIENGGEIHLPCVLLMDTSGSMDEVKEQLYQGLYEFGKSLDDQARGRVEICVVSFDDDARKKVPFGPAYDYQVPEFKCGGMTAMHSAVDFGLNEIESRKAQYRANGTAYYRPWMFMLTDGGANDSDNGAFERLKQAQKEKHVTFFPVAIGDYADKALLKTLREDGIILTASKEDFTGAFSWLGNSLSKTSSSNPDEKVKLPNPKDYQLEIEA